MSLMRLQFAGRTTSALSQFSAQRHDTAMQRISRNYRDTMSGISLAMQNNTQTVNEISARDALIRTGVALQVEGLRQTSEAEAAAAAAGVGGGSVTGTMRSLMRSRFSALHAHGKRKEANQRQNTQARRQAALSAAMNTDITPLTAPSPASALLGLGASLVDIYDSHQTPGDRIAESMSNWGRR